MSDKDVKIPEDLHEIVEKSIQQGLIQRKQRCRRNKTIGLSAVAGCCAFLFFFNTNTVFAKTVMDLQLVNRIAHLFLDSESKREEAAYVAEVRVPQLENNDQAQAMNAAIREQIEMHAASLKQRAADEYEAFIETGGEPAAYIPARISIDYQLYCNNDQTLSFAIISTYVRAQSS